MVERVLGYIEEHFEAHLDRTRALLRQPSISADGTGIAETAALLVGWISELGGEA